MMVASRKKIFLYSFFAFLILIFLIVLFNMYEETGIFQKSKIDSRDLAYWNYSNGSILGTEARLYSASNETCWILVHSYGATPAEMQPLAKKIVFELNQTVYLPLLSGHASVPSNLVDKDITNWYLEINKIIDEYESSCNKINLLGSSLSSPIVLKIAEEREINKIFVLNTFIYMPYKIHRVLPLRQYINLLTPFIHYNKKIEIAQINNINNQENHIAYWNMPYSPIKNSFEFIDETILNLNKISEPIFIAHSRYDPTASKKSASIVFENVNSEVKELIWYDNSSHVLLLDYDKDFLMQDIIEFSKR